MRVLIWLFTHALAGAAFGMPPVWKVVLVAGDDSAPVFDNARLDFGRQLLLRGIPPSHMIDLSASEEQPDTLAATQANLRYALRKLAIGPRDACLLHLTSHGIKEGFLMAEDEPLTPRALDEILREGCGDRPTVVLVSACYSGIFLTREMERPNRVILTAARKDRTSFGCDDQGEYNFWDECLLESLHGTHTWPGLSRQITACIAAKEKALNEQRSLPQAYFGPLTRDLAVPEAGWWTRVSPDALFASLWDATIACYPPRFEPPPDYSADDVCE